MSNAINIINQNTSYRLNVALIKKIVKKVLRRLKKSRGRELEFVFLDDRSIRRLNKEYKKRDIATDVLSFELGAPGTGRDGPLGEIFISIDRAFANARRFGTDPEEELVLYIIHGILHLSGYDDRTRKDRARMSIKEKEVLREICRRENLSRVLTRR